MYKTIEEDEKTRTYIFEPGKKNDEKEKRERKRAQGEGDGWSKKGGCPSPVDETIPRGRFRIDHSSVTLKLITFQPGVIVVITVQVPLVCLLW